MLIPTHPGGSIPRVSCPSSPQELATQGVKVLASSPGSSSTYASTLFLEKRSRGSFAAFLLYARSGISSGQASLRSSTRAGITHLENFDCSAEIAKAGPRYHTFRQGAGLELDRRKSELSDDSSTRFGGSNRY